MGVTITRKQPSIVYCEVRSTKILQLFRSGSDAPVTHRIKKICITSGFQNRITRDLNGERRNSGNVMYSYVHVVHEQGMVSSGRNNSDFDSVFWVPIEKLIIHKDLKYKYIRNVTAQYPMFAVYMFNVHCLYMIHFPITL